MEPVDHVTRVGPGAEPTGEVPYLVGWRWCPLAEAPAQWDEGPDHGCHYCMGDPAGPARQHLRLVATDPATTRGDPVWSNWMIDGQSQTWRQLYQREHDRARHLQLWATLAADLDRCEHGRHEGDVCGGAHGCNGPSLGNPMLDPLGRARRLTERFGSVLPPARLVGFSLAGQPIALPARAERHRPEAWYLRWDADADTYVQAGQ